MDKPKLNAILKSVKTDQKYVIDTFIKKFADDIANIDCRKMSDKGKKPDLTLAINGKKYVFDIKCSLDINRDTGNFTVSTKYPNDAFTNPNKYFAFIDTSSGSYFGNIYVVRQSDVYTYAVKQASSRDYALIPRSYLMANVNTDFSVFSDPEDKERLKLLTGLTYEEIQMQ